MQLDQDKIDAYLTLYQVMVETSKLMAPFAPYLSDEIYINLTNEESVHLADYPTCNESLIDTVLEAEMQNVIDVVSLGRAARNDCQIKIRQPLGKMYVPASLQNTLEKMFELVQEEVNIHRIEYVREEDDFVQYELKPDFKVMGPKYGKQMKTIAAALPLLKGAEVLASFNSKGSFELLLGQESINLCPEDVVVQILPREGFVFATSKDIFVALDTTLSTELIREGFARELVNKIQFSRKEQNFEIMDRIDITWHADEEIAAAIRDFKDYIISETLADSISENASTIDSQMPEYDINGKQVYLGINRARKQ